MEDEGQPRTWLGGGRGAKVNIDELYHREAREGKLWPELQMLAASSTPPPAPKQYT